jgi:hypothetical protein
MYLKRPVIIHQSIERNGWEAAQTPCNGAEKVASWLPQKLQALAAPGAEMASDAMAPCSAAIPAILGGLLFLSQPQTAE